MKSLYKWSREKSFRALSGQKLHLFPSHEEKLQKKIATSQKRKLQKVAKIAAYNLPPPHCTIM